MSKQAIDRTTQERCSECRYGLGQHKRTCSKYEPYVPPDLYTKEQVDRLIREARIDELKSIDYGCDEDVEENDQILKKILDEAKSTIDGRSLRNRIEWLSKHKEGSK